MVGFMIYHIKSKYTAVGMSSTLDFIVEFHVHWSPRVLGRKEIVMFFYLYEITLILEMLLITGIIPISSPAYAVSTW